MKFRSLLALLAVVALFAAGCGGDDDDASDAIDAAGDAADDASDAAEDAADDVSDAVEDASDADVEDVVAGDCDDEAAISGAFNGVGDPNSSPDETRANFEQAIEFFENASDDAPDDLQDDFELVGGYFSALHDVFDSVDFDTSQLAANPELAVEFSQIAQDFDPAQLPEALGNVVQYIGENCG